MKTTEEISNDIEMFEYNDLRGYDNKKDKDFVRFYNKIWYSEEEIKKAIIEVKQWEHHDLSKDWDVELINKLFGDEE